MEQARLLARPMQGEASASPQPCPGVIALNPTVGELGVRGEGSEHSTPFRVRCPQPSEAAAAARSVLETRRRHVERSAEVTQPV